MAFPLFSSPKLYRCHLHRSSSHAHRTSLAAATAPLSATPDGEGTTAPTYGDNFLGCRRATEAIMHVLAPDDSDIRHWCKEKPRTLAWKTSASHSCYGCGTPVRTEEEAASGYVAYCKCIFQMFKRYVANVSCGCCISK